MNASSRTLRAPVPLGTGIAAGRRVDHWNAVAEREHLDYGSAFVEDVSWDGSPMPAELA